MALPRIVDFDRYPIHDLASAEGKTLLARCRKELADRGFLNLPEFLKVDALPALIAEAESGGLRSPHFLKHFPFGTGTQEDSPETVGLSADDPRCFISRTALRFVADDLIPEDSLLRELYDWPGMAAFLAAVLGRDRLYPRADSLSGLNYTVMEAGDEQDWHFDEADFSTTILLQAAEGGGRFQYVRGLRSSAGDDLDGLKHALAGTHDELVSLDLEPGALNLFEGRFAFHRATPVEGGKHRLLAILAFDERPDVRISNDLSRVFYGRKAAPESVRPS
jgi:hypothetical protein